MNTHYVSLKNNPHLLTGQQVEELKKITREKYGDRYIENVDTEVYYEGTYEECETFRNNTHESIKNELITA